MLPAHTGVIGDSLSLDDARAAAHEAALKALSTLEHHVGLAKLGRILRIALHLRTTPDFTAHPQIADAASDVFAAHFPPHARLVFGASSLPLGRCLVLDVVATLEPLPAGG